MPYAEYSINELGIGVKVCPFSQFQTDTKFDLISMFHVLEHLENPVRDLSHLGKFLKSNGKLVIEVPIFFIQIWLFRINGTPVIYFPSPSIH